MQGVPQKRASERGNARRRSIARCALTILGEKGIHALTHRAVDAALELPAGSSSFYFGTRSALVAATSDYLFELDRRDLDAHQDDSGRIDVLKLMRLWTSAPRRAMLLARLELNLLATREIEIRERLLRHRAYFLEIAERTIRHKGAGDAAEAASDLLALMDGELLRAAVFPASERSYRPSAPFSRELSRYR